MATREDKDDMFRQQPYTEVPYVPADQEENLRRRGGVWYRRPMVLPILIGVILVGAVYFAYQMYRGTHPDDGFAVSGPQGSPATSGSSQQIASTSGSTDQTSRPNSIESVEASSNQTPAPDAPASDSQPVQPPNGKAYAGTGHLELYRQGNITYQYNTDNGDSCVMYASLREWRNPLVYNHSCR